LLILVGLAALWQWTALGDWLDVNTLAEKVTALRNHPITPLVVIGGYVVGSLALIPITVLIIATAIAFGPLLGFVYSLWGCLISAMLTYGIGYLLGHEAIRSRAGAPLSRLSRHIASHGLIAVLIVRVVPVAPFMVVNMIAGAAHIRLRDFVLGTCLGMFPGLLVMSVFGDQLEDIIREPKVETFVVLIGLITLIVLLTVWVRRRFLNLNSFAATGLSTDESPHG
jgi:uncharacterized membrane protein YdjX (TVP38/TMEM64 family)